MESLWARKPKLGVEMQLLNTKLQNFPYNDLFFFSEFQNFSFGNSQANKPEIWSVFQNKNYKYFWYHSHNRDGEKNYV